jgi:hypothetical protein
MSDVLAALLRRDKLTALLRRAMLTLQQQRIVVASALDQEISRMDRELASAVAQLEHELGVVRHEKRKTPRNSQPV